jgi:hypothetical protein
MECSEMPLLGPAAISIEASIDKKQPTEYLLFRKNRPPNVTEANMVGPAEREHT